METPAKKVSRRGFLATSLATSLASALATSAGTGLLALGARQSHGANRDALATALGTSELVYLTPLLASGAESRCHGEVWFVFHDGAIHVVTARDAWRARAVRQGLDRVRLWVGEHGRWPRSGDAFRQAPMVEARGRLVEAQGAQAAALEAFGDKYREEWGTWGPRFRNGLAEGSRVLLRYETLGL